MTASQLLAQLQHRYIQLWVEDGYLEYDAPEGALTSELLQQIGKNKQDLINKSRQVMLFLFRRPSESLQCQDIV